MEIHGSDFLIKSSIPIADSLIRFLVKDHWPSMVYEIMSCDNDGSIDLFLYRDEAALKAWDEEGWSDENDETMIYVILAKESKEISITIDDDSNNKYIVEDIAQFIRKIDGNTKQD
jgi:hypothetical protein